MGKEKETKMKWFILLLGCFLLLLFVFKQEYKEDDLNKWNEKYVGLNEATGMLVFSQYTQDDWMKLLDNAKDREMKYVDLKNILEGLGASKYVSYDKKADAKIVPREVWIDVYDQLRELLDSNEMVAEQSVFLLSKNSEEELVKTQYGELSFKVPDGYLEEGRAFKCYVYNSCIIGISETENVEVILSNVYLIGTEGKEANFLFAGDTYSFKLKDSVDEISGVVCDLKIKTDKILEIDKKQETISGNLLTIDDEKIEIDGYGQLKRAATLPVYKTFGTIEEKAITDIVIGNMNATYVVAEDEVCAVLLNQPADLTNIRVLLLNQDGNVYRQDAYITCDGDFQITYGESVLLFQPGMVCDTSAVLTMVGEGYVRIEPLQGASLFLSDASGTPISYGYEGAFEVRRYDSGYVVINDVSIEKYLYQVVTSEMPSTYKLEALKAQAVCARSYAYRQMLKGDYAQFGAHVDDSTNYQVYNRQEHTDIARTAVDDTSGEILECNGEVVEALYFSTSCGMTENDCIWNNNIPDDYAFLKVVHVSPDATTIDLSDEQVFYQYITNMDATCFDNFAHYFRWNSSFPLTDEKKDQIAQIIAVRKEANPDNILIYDQYGNPTDTILNLGKLISISTKTRGSGGAVLDLYFQFENGSAEVFTEYNVRKIIGSLVDVIHLNDGTDADANGLLPSAYFTLVWDQNTATYTIYGGGYGHGAGMSQNGAQGMAQSGYGYKDILNFFFQNITIKVKG